MATSSSRNTSTNTPEPGARVFIKRGDFGGEVGTVGCILPPPSAAQAGRTLPIVFEPPVIFDGVHVIAAYVEPGNVQPVPTELVDEPKEYEKVDPWAPRIAAWLTTLHGEASVNAGLTTGEIIEDALEVPDNFSNQIRVMTVMRSLGYEKVERCLGNSKEWHWVRVTGASPEHGWSAERYITTPGASAGLVVALAGLISWLLDKAANVDRLAQLAHSILGSPQFQLRKHGVKYFEWVREGASWLGKLQVELRAQEITNPGDMLGILIAGQVAGQHRASPLEIAEFHRTIVQILANGARLRGGLEVDFGEQDRTPAVNGWITALVLMGETARRLSIEARAGRCVPAGASPEAIADDLLRQAEACEWIVDAMGGAPTTDEDMAVPMLDLASFVDAAMCSTQRSSDTEPCPAPEREGAS